MKKPVLLSLWVCCLISNDCFGLIDPNHTTGGISTPDDADTKLVVAGNTDFAFALYDRLKNNSDGTSGSSNLFFSPYSISTALAMTYTGARGETQKQMAATLHFTFPMQNLCSAFGSLQKQIVQKDKSLGYQVLLANALWGQKGEPFLKKFLDLTEHYHGAGLNQFDFVNETEKSRQAINNWVEEKTNNKIKDLIPPGGVDEQTVLVLTNAVYFKGQWKAKFSWWKTRKSDFSISDNDKVKVPLMHLKEKYNYYKNEKLQAIEMPYKGDEISMLIFLPQEMDGLKDVENILTTEKLDTILLKMATREVDAYIPRFKITWESFSLREDIIALGISDAFDPAKADFSGMIDKNRKIWISNVFQKAVVEVNEEGTEAAAATAGVMKQSIHIEPPVFRADHPFLFIIRDTRSGSILFMGRMMNPAVQE